jgi:hypothetical protein
MKRYSIVFYLLLIFFSNPIQSQSVWPGDINNNGEVDGVDLLYWGLAFGTTGPQRAAPSVDWQAQPLVPWSANFPSGPNYAFADCNGDGVVDEGDFEDAIEENFGLFHGPLLPNFYANAAPGDSKAPRIRLSTNTPVVQEGAIVDISFRLEDPDQTINDFYGIAFTLSYTTEYLSGDDGLDFDLKEDNWIGADDTYIQELFVDNDGSGSAMLAITRTNQEGIPIQNTEIGRLKLVIEDIIVGLLIDTVRVQVDSIRLITKDFRSIPAMTDQIEIIVAKDTNLVVTSQKKYHQVIDATQVKVFPNPVQDGFYLETPDWPDDISLFDNLGRIVNLPKIDKSRSWLQLDPSSLRAGLYWLRLRFKDQIVLKKIIFLPKN